MTDPVIMITRLPGDREWLSGKWDTTVVDCGGDDHAYGRALAEAWASDRTVVNVEHDLECSDELIQELLDCPEPLCARTYLVYAVSGIHDAPAYPFCVTNPGPWVTGGEEWAAWAAPGFFKATPEARMPNLPVRHWLCVEDVVNDWVTTRWHLHWPAIEHDHKS